MLLSLAGSGRERIWNWIGNVDDDWATASICTKVMAAMVSEVDWDYLTGSISRGVATREIDYGVHTIRGLLLLPLIMAMVMRLQSCDGQRSNVIFIWRAIRTDGASSCVADRRTDESRGVSPHWHERQTHRRTLVIQQNTSVCQNPPSLLIDT